MTLTGNARRMPIAYGQMFEDTFLFRMFGDQSDGFYLDIGGWHPTKYNVSYPFYLRGWRGVVVEPIQDYVDLTRRLRPGDVTIQALVGECPGEAVLHRAGGVDGLSTTIEAHVPAAMVFGAEMVAQRYPVVTATEICEQHAPAVIDFLKIDVEGAESSVLAGLDLDAWHPRVLVVEATVPGTDIPAWDEWEPPVLAAGYRLGLFDGLNRYYVAEEEVELLAKLRPEEKPWGEATYLEDLGPAAIDLEHPDHGSALALHQTLLGNMAAMPNSAAALIVADLIREPRSVALRILADRLPAFGCGLPEWREGESITGFVERLLLSETMLPVLARLSAQLAR